MPPPNTPGEALVGRLMATAAVTARIGDRLFPLRPDQDPPNDYVCYRKVAGGGGKRLNGRNALQSYLLRVTCYSTSQQAAEATLKAIITALTGGWVDKTNGIHGCFDAEDQDDDLDADGCGDMYKTAGQTFELWFKG